MKQSIKYLIAILPSALLISAMLVAVHEPSKEYTFSVQSDHVTVTEDLVIHGSTVLELDELTFERWIEIEEEVMREEYDIETVVITHGHDVFVYYLPPGDVKDYATEKLHRHVTNAYASNEAKATNGEKTQVQYVPILEPVVYTVEKFRGSPWTFVQDVQFTDQGVLMDMEPNWYLFNGLSALLVLVSIVACAKIHTSSRPYSSCAEY